MNETNEEVVLEGGLDIEKGFNDAIDDLRKSLGHPDVEGSQEKLLKAKAPSFKKKDEDEEPEEGEEEEEEDEYRKSIEDALREEPEAAAAMDVEPFLLQLAKAIDEGIDALGEMVSARVGKVEKLVKSIGNATVASAELQKSTREIVKQIGDTPLPSGSVRQLKKARFDVEGGDPQEFDTREVLAKSRDWVKTGKMDLLEAGNLEGRINKQILGKVHDRLDQKVVALMREAS